MHWFPQSFSSLITSSSNLNRRSSEELIPTTLFPSYWYWSELLMLFHFTSCWSLIFIERKGDLQKYNSNNSRKREISIFLPTSLERERGHLFVYQHQRNISIRDHSMQKKTDEEGKEMNSWLGSWMLSFYLFCLFFSYCHKDSQSIFITIDIIFTSLTTGCPSSLISLSQETEWIKRWDRNLVDSTLISLSLVLFCVTSRRQDLLWKDVDTTTEKKTGQEMNESGKGMRDSEEEKGWIVSDITWERDSWEVNARKKDSTSGVPGQEKEKITSKDWF